MKTREILQEIIHEFKSNLKGLSIATGPFILAATLIMFFAQITLNNLNSYMITFATFFITIVFNAFITLVGLQYFFNRQSIAINITKSNIFTYCFTTAYISIASSLGYLFFIIPGILILCISFFYPIFILKDNQGPIQAIESSIEIVKNNLKQMLLLYFSIVLAVGAINYIASYIIEYVPMPFQTHLIIIDLISHFTSLIYIPFMLVVYDIYNTRHDEALKTQPSTAGTPVEG